jgi:hypothetical protein
MIRLFAGLLLAATGTYLALHPLWSHGQPVTVSRWLDAGLALLLLLRAWTYLRAWRRASR